MQMWAWQPRSGPGACSAPCLSLHPPSLLPLTPPDPTPLRRHPLHRPVPGPRPDCPGPRRDSVHPRQEEGEEGGGSRRGARSVCAWVLWCRYVGSRGHANWAHSYSCAPSHSQPSIGPVRLRRRRPPTHRAEPPANTPLPCPRTCSQPTHTHLHPPPRWRLRSPMTRPAPSPTSAARSSTSRETAW